MSLPILLFENFDNLVTHYSSDNQSFKFSTCSVYSTNEEMCVPSIPPSKLVVFHPWHNSHNGLVT